VRKGFAKHLRCGTWVRGSPPSYPPPVRRLSCTAQSLGFVVGRASQLPDVEIERTRKIPHHCRHTHRGHQKCKVRQPRIVPVDTWIGEFDCRIWHVADSMAVTACLSPEPAAVFHGIEHHHVLVEPLEKGVESTIRSQQASSWTPVLQPYPAPFKMLLDLFVHARDDSKYLLGCK